MTVTKATCEYNRQFTTICIDSPWMHPHFFKDKNKWPKDFAHEALKIKGKIWTSHKHDQSKQNWKKTKGKDPQEVGLPSGVASSIVQESTTL